MPIVIGLKLAVGEIPHLKEKACNSSTHLPRRNPTFTSLSQPHETITGFCVLGEKRTHETQSVWQSSCNVKHQVYITHEECGGGGGGGGTRPRTWMVYLHTPSVFHSFTVLSRDPDTICRLSAENATLRTSLVCPTNLLVVRPLQGHGT